MTIGYNPFDEDFSLEDLHEYKAMAISLREENLRLKKNLKEYKDKIEQGTLIELPCPIRTMVYYIASYEKKNVFLWKKKYCTTIMEIPFELDMLDSYGNNWFLTREEAEKRLKELQNG